MESIVVNINLLIMVLYSNKCNMEANTDKSKPHNYWFKVITKFIGNYCIMNIHLPLYLHNTEGGEEMLLIILAHPCYSNVIITYPLICLARWLLHKRKLANKLLVLGTDFSKKTRSMMHWQPLWGHQQSHDTDLTLEGNEEQLTWEWLAITSGKEWC